MTKGYPPRPRPLPIGSAGGLRKVSAKQAKSLRDGDLATFPRGFPQAYPQEMWISKNSSAKTAAYAWTLKLYLRKLPSGGPRAVSG